MSQQNAANAQVNSTIRMIVKADRNDATGMFKTQGGPASYYIRKLSSYFGAIETGSINANIQATPGMVYATGTVTFSSFAAADTVTINGAVFTASASPSGANQFLVTGGDTLAAAALTAKINSATAPAKVLGCVTATSAGAVITVTCVVPGLIGNTQTLAISAHGSVSAANLASGAEGVTATWAKGL